MIIEVVIFFIWMFVVLVVGVLVTLRRKRQRLQRTDNVTNAKLTFPQRNWLPICLIVALVSPLAVAGFKAVTHKSPDKVAVDRNGAAYLGGDTTVRDTSYHVATPPQH